MAALRGVLNGGLQGMVGQATKILFRGRAGQTVLFALFLGVTGLASTLPARAQFAVCNQTLDALNVAIAKASADGIIVSEGWWTIGANRCVDLIKEELANKYIYVYATDVFGQPILTDEGTGSQMCVGAKRFTIEGTDSCWQRGFQAVRFMEVDTKDQARWTLFLKEPYAG